MYKKRVLVIFLSAILVFLLVLYFNDENKTTNMLTRMITLSFSKASYVDDDLKIVEVDTSELSENTNVEEQLTEEEEGTNAENTTDSGDSVEEEASDDIVYDGLTLDELASRLDGVFKNELSGKGYLYASYSLANGVDPYLAAAISLEETGCNWNCSNLVKSCNNVGGMKGSGCGSYGYFDTLDDGIRAFIDNIAKNYVAYGLTTAETMNSKYAENPAWSTNVNNYINIIKNS